MPHQVLRRIATSLILLAAPCPADADTVADHFRGKRVSILVSYETGGAYDLYARMFAQFFSRHLPGQPTVIVQNMPGAGGLKAARYLLEVAPKDGTALGLLSQTMPFDTALGYTEGVDAGKFNWIGRIAMNVEVGVAGGKSDIHSFNDARARETSVGGTGGTASSTVMPFLLSRLADAKFRLVSGYRSAHDVLLAMERGEVDMVGCSRNFQHRRAMGIGDQEWFVETDLPELAQSSPRISDAADHWRTRARRRGQADPRLLCFKLRHRAHVGGVAGRAAGAYCCAPPGNGGDAGRSRAANVRGRA